MLLKKTDTASHSPIKTRVTYSDVERASNILSGHSKRTPIHSSSYLNNLTGTEVFLKCENFQRTGAFKFRGAFNALSILSAGQGCPRGVLTFSSGNHGQALALAGRILGVPVFVIMPEDAPEIKRRATAGYGATIISYDKFAITREELATRIASERDLPVIPPYDHVDVVAGQGTVCKEFHEQIEGLDIILTPCGGGGLLSGSAITTKHLNPLCRVIGVEPASADDATRSFYSGTIQTVENPDTVADGARTPFLGNITFPIVRRYVDEMVTVSEQSIITAMALVWERMKLIIEPTGALALAALIENKVSVSGARTGVVISGGNVDIRSVSSLFERFPHIDLPPGRDQG